MMAPDTLAYKIAGISGSYEACGERVEFGDESVLSIIFHCDVILFVKLFF